MFCGECGEQNPDTNQFCRNCGKPLTRRPPAPQPMAPSAPAPGPVPAAQPVVPVPVRPAVAAEPPGSAPAAAPKRPRNWLGILSLVLGILSWVILTGILAISAVLAGIAGIIVFRKATGRIGITSLIGILLGIAAVAVSIALA